MPSGIYVRTKEHNNNISKALRGKPSGRKGKKLSNEHKQRISFVRKGQRIADETKRKMSLAKIGCVPWNKGIKMWDKTPHPRGRLGKKCSDEHKRKLRLVNKGKSISQETRRKIRETLRGRKHIEETRRKMSKKYKERLREGWISPLKGRKYSKEQRRRKSESMMGEKGPNWRGGTSFEPYGIEFNRRLKEQIRKRDHYRCQQCFRHQDELYTKTGKKRKLSIHHIDFNKRNNNPNNLISLCQPCHSQTQFKREDWINYFQERLI